jgi:oxygen-independent coproporphyrinogen-3 oxidase
LALYIHWPFCLAKCPYCDFNSHVASAIDQRRWQAALLRALRHAAARTTGRTVTSVFFGGGTPSLMHPDLVEALLAAVARLWMLAGDAEITLEANPTSAEAACFAGFAAAGVNRLSIGVQALDDDALARLGRQHDAVLARAAVHLARRSVARVSFDLIYARPGQTLAAWRDELADAVDLAGEHLSVYQLGIEPGTRFWRDRVAACDEDLAADLYALTQEMLGTAGLPAYEISNHARPGGACRHNLTIWQGGDYLGIGPGAHGRLTRDGVTLATRAIRTPETWLAAVEAGGSGAAAAVPLSPAERREELLLMGLRLGDGIDRRAFRARTGIEPEMAVDPAALDRLRASGHLVTDGRGLRATCAGRPVLNALTAALLA